MINTDPPPPGFSTGSLWSSPLRVYYFNEKYYVYDHKGYLCNCELRELRELLIAEAKRKPDDLHRPHYWPRARDFVHPGYAEEEERKHLEIRNFIPPKPYEKRVKEDVSKITLEDLGL